MKADRLSGNTCTSTCKNHRGVLHKVFLTIFLLAVGPGAFAAADFQVGSGDAFDLGGGTLNLECGNLTLQNGAVFNAGSGNIYLSGNWDNQGDFIGGGSRVTFNDDCGPGTVSEVSGETFFNNLTASTVAAHELQLEAGMTQSIANALVLTGAEGQLLKIRSSSAGSRTYFVVDQGGSQTIAYVDVQDNHASPPGQWLAPNAPEFFNSIDSGGNRYWFRIGLEDIPTLSGIGLAILVLLLLAVSLRRTDRMIRT